MWTQRIFNHDDGTVEIVEPEKTGDYFVTDGYHVHLGHFRKGIDLWDSWGLYATDSWGIIKHCFNIDDMNFDIIAFQKLEAPEISADIKRIAENG
jgi:hypothetical protein